MATSIATIKGWFQTSLKPTQAQFYAVFDSYWHKDSLIPIASVDGLQTQLNTINASIPPAPVSTTIVGSGSVSIPAGKLLDVIVVISNSAQNVTVEKMADAGDVMDNEAMTDGQEEVIALNLYGSTAGKTLLFECTNSITVKYQLKNL